MAEKLPYKRHDRLEKHLGGVTNALELPENAEHAQLIGVVLSWFAGTELLIPKALRRLTKGTLKDAIAIMSVFRAFSNKIDVLESVIKNVPDGPEKEVASYVKGHFTEANKIRNRYAHGLYLSTPQGLHIAPYGKRSRATPLTIKELRRDAARIKRLQQEIYAIVDGRLLPPALHDRLQQQFPK